MIIAKEKCAKSKDNLWKMVNILTTIATFLIILSTTPIRGLDRDHWGTHFVLTFLAYNDTDIKNNIVITAREHVNVSVIFHETNNEHYIELAAGTSQIIPYDDNTTVGPFHQVLPKKAVSVESSSGVSVYGMVRSKNYGDGFLVLPVMVLGIEYITVNCNSTRGSQIAIAAVEDSTNVTVNLKPWQYNHCNMYQNQTLNNSDITFVLSSYDVIQMNCEMDLTGSLITSTKPVAVITGCTCGRAGVFHTYDYMNEMIPPTSNFGKHHIIVKPEEHNVIFRIVTSAFTLVTIKNDTHTVEPREFLDIQANGSAQIISTQSVLVVMYMVGSTGTSSSVGGPLMMIIPSTNRYTTHYVVNTAVNKLYSNYSIIIANSSTYTQFTQPHFNGEYFTYTQLHNIALQHVIADTPYQYDIHPLADTILNIKASSPVCFLVYSVSENTGIGYPGGMNISDFSGENECQYNPCHNNGWCLEVGDGYRCRCTQHFTGPNCGEEVSTSISIMNTTVITTFTTMTTTYNHTTDNTTPNITTEATSLSTTTATTPITIDIATPNTTEITNLNTTTTPTNTEMTTPNTTEMTTSNATTTSYTTEMTTLNTTEVTVFNTTVMTTRNTTEMTTPNTTKMTTPNTTEMTTPNTTEMTTPNTTEMTTPNTTEMTTPNTTEMETPNTTEMTTPNTTEMTTPNTTEMTTPNTTEMTTLNTTEMTTYSGFDPTQGTVATQETINSTASSDSTTEANINQTDITSSSTTHDESHNTSETEISTASANVAINTTAASPSIMMDGTTPVAKYTTTEGTDKNHLIDSTSMCSLNDIATNPNLTNFYLKCNDTLYWCNCPCPLNDSYVNLLERLTSQYQRLLLLDAELLGKTIRKKTSAINYRDSHTYLGVSSVGITLIFLSSVVLLDLTNLLKWCCERYKGQKVRFVRKRRPF